MAFCLVFASHNRPVGTTEEQSPSISQSERALETQIIFFSLFYSAYCTCILFVISCWLLAIFDVTMIRVSSEYFGLNPGISTLYK